MSTPVQNSRTNNLPQLKLFRRALRNHSTKAEKALWNWLKGNKIEGLRFRRQFSIEHFVLDFYCPQLKLAIELDGEYHYHGSMVVADDERDAYLLEKYGVTTLRFENYIVFEQPYTIKNAILLAKREKDFRDKHSEDTLPPTPSNLEGELAAHTTTAATESPSADTLPPTPSNLEGELPEHA